MILSTQPGPVIALFLICALLSCNRINHPKGESGDSSPNYENYLKAKKDYERDSTDLENIIWLGRRTAYLGNYHDAIDIYSRGLVEYPEEPRLLRHRGHRYISTRQFDKAISDLERACALIKGQKNSIEQDGLPNKMNIPISTKHGNIWYHLGLAYYLIQDYDNSWRAYLECRNTGTNDDNIVSSTHWLYMIQRRMGNDSLAELALSPIQEEMNIIENHSYYDLCRFYKGLIPVDSLLNEDNSPSGDASTYGLINWYFYNGDTTQTMQLMKTLISSEPRNSFGYIAAESDPQLQALHRGMENLN